VNGAHGTLAPTPLASLAPIALYEIGAFGGGGATSEGAVGESRLNN
jgi:hypothetical protein